MTSIVGGGYPYYNNSALYVQNKILMLIPSSFVVSEVLLDSVFGVIMLSILGGFKVPTNKFVEPCPMSAVSDVRIG